MIAMNLLLHCLAELRFPIQLKAPLYQPDWEEVSAKITPRTRMVIINSPHNPSGMLFSENDMLQLQELAEKNDLLVISDEVYEHIIFDGNIHQSAARFEALSKRTFITASFGKTFHNTGWKMGYCAGPEALMTEFNKVHQYNVFCVNHPVQKGLATYLGECKSLFKSPKLLPAKKGFVFITSEGFPLPYFTFERNLFSAFGFF